MTKPQMAIRKEILKGLLDEEDLLESVFNYQGQIMGIEQIVERLGDIPRFVAIGERTGHGAGFWIGFFADVDEAEMRLDESAHTVPGIIRVVFDLSAEMDVPWSLKVQR